MGTSLWNFLGDLLTEVRDVFLPRHIIVTPMVRYVRFRTPVFRNFFKRWILFQKDGKIIYAWAAEGDFDTKKSESNTFKMEWPPKSGKKIDAPEIDRVEYFDANTAKTKINPAQIELIDRLENILKIDLQ